MKKRIILTIMLAVVAFANMVHAGEWVQEGTDWKYKDDNGSFLTSTWKFLQVGENSYGTYYFDENGIMATGLQKIDDRIYAFEDDGRTMTNSTITIDGEKYETKNRGLVEDLVNDFDVVAYNAKIKAEKQQRAESIAAEQARQKAIAESLANRSPAEIAAEEASIAAEIAAEEASIAASEAAEEAKRIELLNNTIRIGKMLPDAVTIEGEDKGKVVVTILVPTLVGGNSDVINPVLKDKIKQEVYSIYESRFGETTSKLTYKVKDIDLHHDLANHTLTFRFYDTNGYTMFILYMDTNTLQMWSS